MPRKVAPRGLPSWRRVCGSWCGSFSEREVLRRKSWVTAMPIEAKAREVRSHARKVRSNRKVQYAAVSERVGAEE